MIMTRREAETIKKAKEARTIYDAVHEQVGLAWRAYLRAPGEGKEEQKIYLAALKEGRRTWKAYEIAAYWEWKAHEIAAHRKWETYETAAYRAYQKQCPNGDLAKPERTGGKT